MKMTSDKTVAVIGAGPSGLVAAKSMLEVGLSPTLFDKAPAIGGMWNPKSDTCWESLKTNISRYSCSFSDFPWNAKTPMFLSQHQIYDYLEDYASKFLRLEHFSLGSEVTSVTKSSDGRWAVEWSSSEGKRSEVFDFLVFASGYFSVPYTPSIQGLDAFAGEVIHSSEYRSPERFKDKRVVVAGGSLSSTEIAAEIASYATQVVNVIRRPMWILPRYVALEPDSANTPFVPLDFVFNRRSSRPSSPSSTEEQYQKQNKYLRKLCGDQGSLNPQHDNDPPIMVISDTYEGFVRSKRIVVQFGKMEEFQGHTVILEDHTILADIDCIIFCTGFQTTIPYLPSEILDILSFDRSDKLLPFLLHMGTFHPYLPRSAFVGMCRGPFFGIMELQARWAAAIFSGILPPVSDAVQQEGVALQKKIKHQIPRPQFPYGSFVSFADSIAAELNVLPSKDWCDKHDVVIPAHFRTGSVAENTVESLENACQEFSVGKMVPHAVFRSLAGSWTLHRRIDNRMDSTQCGTVEGTANFSAMVSPQEYLYSENGELGMKGGQHFRVYRKYVYVYDANADQIDIFFENQGTRGSHFHSLRFLSREGSSAIGNRADEQGATGRGWKAEGKHLCSEDTYHASYRFDFLGNSIAKMEISYSVVGPKKNYTSTATYLR